MRVKLTKEAAANVYRAVSDADGYFPKQNVIPQICLVVGEPLRAYSIPEGRSFSIPRTKSQEVGSE